MFRDSGFFFLALIGLVFLGFSKTYFFKLDESFPLFIHLHVLFLGAWLLLITGQTFLIRANQRLTHKQLGELSYILAPVIVISGIYLSRTHFYQRIGSTGLDDNLEFLWWAVSHFVFFGLFFALAIIYRKKMALHARYMITATLLFVSPALLRALDVMGMTLGQLSSMELSFIAVDLILLTLVINDLKNKHSPIPFVVGLSAFLFIQVGVKFAGESAIWRSVAGLIVDV